MANAVEKTFVLVHGAHHGGWCWRVVADCLRDDGRRVFTPTCTGMGERKHLLSRDITLETFIDDVAGLIEAEELHEVVLVGHSFGGLIVAAIADRMPERIRRIVFLDALLVRPGQTAFDGLPRPLANARKEAAMVSSDGLTFPAPTPAAFGVFDEPAVSWLSRRLLPQPLNSYTAALSIRCPIGNHLHCTYISCSNPPYEPLASVKDWVVTQTHWEWLEIATGHDAMVTAPLELARMLIAGPVGL